MLRALVWGAVATAGAALALHVSGEVPLGVPAWFYLAAGAAPSMVALVVVGWRRTDRRGRAAAALAVPAAATFAFVAINDHYAYWPTVGSVLGYDHVDPVLTRLGTRGHLLDPTAVAMSWGHPDGRGRLVQVTIPGRTSGFHARPAEVWLPPAYDASPHLARPVVELLAGTPSWTGDWTRSVHVDRIADRYAAVHGGEAPIVVMPDPNGRPFGDTECVDGPRGRAETYLTVDVPAFVEDAFAARHDPAGWAVAGYSEGGTCAVTLALRHPDLYRAFADLSGDLTPNLGGTRATLTGLFGGSTAARDAHDAPALLRRGRYPLTAGFFGAGRDDTGPRTATATLAELAQAAGMRVRTDWVPGGHDFRVWSQAFAEAFPWLADHVGT